MYKHTSYSHVIYADSRSVYPCVCFWIYPHVCIALRMCHHAPHCCCHRLPVLTTFPALWHWDILLIMFTLRLFSLAMTIALRCNRHQHSTWRVRDRHHIALCCNRCQRITWRCLRLVSLAIILLLVAIAGFQHAMIRMARQRGREWRERERERERERDGPWSRGTFCLTLLV